MTGFYVSISGELMRRADDRGFVRIDRDNGCGSG